MLILICFKNLCALSIGDSRFFKSSSFVIIDLNCVKLYSTYVSLFFFRSDDKTAADYKVTGGSVLHLVLALRGGFNGSISLIL